MLQSCRLISVLYFAFAAAGMASAQTPAGKNVTPADVRRWSQCLQKHSIKNLSPSDCEGIWKSFKDRCGFRPSIYLDKTAIQQGRFDKEHLIYDLINNSVYSARIKKMAGKRYDALRYSAEVTTEYYFTGADGKVLVGSAVNFADQATAVCLYADLSRDVVYLGHIDRGVPKEAFYEDLKAYGDPQGGEAFASCVAAMEEHTRKMFHS
ncbi:hypothetical protein L1281_000970 [Neisseria sp. HSC-16F19]|nr:hypothetical protein [Neisseria sp. HSC-16F19]MCP2040387.1 hypothetical protein [Neisseria sp. HSC-16F19]